jgi:diacylglycerol kinase family enzyme
MDMTGVVPRLGPGDRGNVPQSQRTQSQRTQSQRTQPTALERLAAAVALLALAGAVALLLAGIVRHWVTVLIAIVSLTVCVSAGWYAVSRRGLIRFLALSVLPVAVAGLITAMIFADLSVARLLDVIVLGALSVAAGRLALTRSARARHGASVRLTPAARPARPVLIMNPKSGGGKAVKFGLEQQCVKRQIEPILLHPGDDLLQLAENAIARGADALGMAGGDGSQALVASVAARHGIPHVCVPAGTRNHFALDLGLDRDDVVGALAAFADGVERRIDLGRVNGRVFVNNASLGLYAKVVQAPDYRDAKVRTAGTMLPELVGPDAHPLDLRFRGPDGASYPTAQLILVSNDPYQLDHIGGLGTRERIDLGVLGIVTARIGDAADARRFAALEAAGQVRRFPGWLEWNSPRFEVGSGAPVEIGIDGEALLMDPPLFFESLPGVLRVLLPRTGIRPSPAARAVRVLTGSAIAELGQITVGHQPHRRSPGRVPGARVLAGSPPDASVPDASVPDGPVPDGRDPGKDA